MPLVNVRLKRKRDAKPGEIPVKRNGHWWVQRWVMPGKDTPPTPFDGRYRA